MSALELLREIAGETRGGFEALVSQYRRIGRDYAALAQALIADPGTWDGQGEGFVTTAWTKLFELEHRRETLRVGALSHLLNNLEIAGNDFEKLRDIADDYAEQKSMDYEICRDVIRSEMVRRLAVSGITMLRNDGYGLTQATVGPKQTDKDAMEQARSMLRSAVQFSLR